MMISIEDAIFVMAQERFVEDNPIRSRIDSFIAKHGYDVFTLDGRIDLKQLVAGYQLCDHGFDRKKFNAMLRDLNDIFGMDFKELPILEVK